MTKRNAIKILERQKANVSEYGENLIWINITMSHFEAFWGKESSEYKLIYSFYSPRNLYNSKSKQQVEAERKEDRERLVKLLDEAIEIVKLRGINTAPKTNFLRRLNDTRLVTIITLIITVVFPALFWAGFWFGTHDMDKKELPAPNQQPQKEAPQPASNNNNIKH